MQDRMAPEKGFRIPKRTARLVFEEDTEYPGAVITVRLDVPIGNLMEIQDLLVNDETAMQGLLRFADVALESWNLEDDGGRALAANAEGMKAIPPALAMFLVWRWVEAVKNPPGPLSPISADGATSEAASGATETR